MSKLKMARNNLNSNFFTVDVLSRYQLPDNDENSDEEADFDACSELQELDPLETSCLSSDNSFVCSEQSDDSNDDMELDPLDLNFDDMEVDVDPRTIDNDDNTDWSTDVSAFEKINDFHSFGATVKHHFSEQDSEIKYFQSIFNADITSHIIRETNRYAHGKPSSDTYVDVTEEEFNAFLGMLIFMGIHVLPRLENYWSSDPALNVPVISNVMNSKRYKKIVEVLHCNDNNTDTPRSDPAHDKLHKLRPIIDKINGNIKKVYVNSSHYAVDESMVLFTGRSLIKQYQPKKPIPRGYLSWCLADATTGFVTNFEIYTGKSSNSDKDDKSLLGERVVLKLTTSIDNKKPVMVVFDNFFTSVPLLKKLRKRNIYSCGTVRRNRKYLPETWKTKKTKQKAKDRMKRGEYKYFTKSGVSAVQWMDNKEVFMLSTLHDPKKIVSVKRKTKKGTTIEVPCPEVVQCYNSFMGGVDRFDQLRERYEIGRRSIKWWHRLFYFLVDLAIVNSFILWKLSKPNTTQDQLSFRINLAKQLIANFSSRKQRGKPAQYLSKVSVPKETRLANVGTHLPKAATFRRCRLCTSKGKGQKRTKYYCATCLVPLCMPECFNEFHK